MATEKFKALVHLATSARAASTIRGGLGTTVRLNKVLWFTDLTSYQMTGRVCDEREVCEAQACSGRSQQRSCAAIRRTRVRRSRKIVRAGSRGVLRSLWKYCLPQRSRGLADFLRATAVWRKMLSTLSERTFGE